MIVPRSAFIVRATSGERL